MDMVSFYFMLGWAEMCVVVSLWENRLEMTKSGWSAGVHVKMRCDVTSILISEIKFGGV